MIEHGDPERRQPQLAPSKWLRDYALLALRLQRVVDAQGGPSLLDYFGPPEWQAQVAAEQVQSCAQLLHAVAQLQESIAGEGFEPSRARFLSKHLDAFRTVARRLNGAELSLHEEVLGCFDLRVGWLRETVFEEAHALYDAGLPGRGDVAERLRRWRAGSTLPPERSHLLVSFLKEALAHARNLTHEILPLPTDEFTDIEPVLNRPVWAVAAYQGHHRSRIRINPDVPFPLPELFYVLCHEGYPGHLTEVLLKEESLVQERGCLEQQVRFMLSPSFVISEGLALLAPSVIFAPGDQERWLAEHVYPVAGMKAEGDLSSIHRARDLLRGVSCNAAFMLRDGRSDREVMAYLGRYALLDDEHARNELATLSRKLLDAYTFTYFHGRRLIDGALRGPGRLEKLRWLMTQQVLPSDLESTAPGQWLT